ncbi:hypothetical protein Tco_1258852 [Tanacetum coccineum]
MDVDHLDQLHRDALKQKSRLEWAVEGDENTRFFHYILKHKYANFNIKGIHVDGIWCESPVIKEAHVRHFSSRFQEDNRSRPTFSSSLFRRLFVTVANLLEANITMEKIKSAVCDYDGSKAPGPDDFNFKFIKSYWEIVKYDFLDCVKYFEATGKLANGCNPSSILLKSSMGGLGVGSLFAKNIGLLGKWKWRFLIEKEALWRTVIKEFYEECGGFGSLAGSRGPNGIWCDIIKVVEDIEKIDPSFKRSSHIKVSNGANVSFWKDTWRENGTRLIDLFPRLYALDPFQDCKIVDRWHLADGSWCGKWDWILSAPWQGYW